MRTILLRLVIDDDDDTCDELIRDDVNAILARTSDWRVELVEEEVHP